MCRSCPDVNKLRGMETTILGQHRHFTSIKSFVQHSGWQEMVSLCSLIRLIGVCADRDQPEFLCSRSDSRHLEVLVATAGGWLTRYRPREVRNSIYRYRKIHIDYRSKFLYRFISPISIIYGNTTWHITRLSKLPTVSLKNFYKIFQNRNYCYFPLFCQFCSHPWWSNMCFYFLPPELLVLLTPPIAWLKLMVWFRYRLIAVNCITIYNI